jgi:hypothetical protein
MTFVSGPRVSYDQASFKVILSSFRLATQGAIGETERYEVAWCTKSGRGARVIPDNTLKGVHFVKTPDYVQITGQGDFTKINIPAGDSGGELDNRGADARGNPSTSFPLFHIAFEVTDLRR